MFSLNLLSFIQRCSHFASLPFIVYSLLLNHLPFSSVFHLKPPLTSLYFLLYMFHPSHSTSHIGQIIPQLKTLLRIDIAGTPDSKSSWLPQTHTLWHPCCPQQLKSLSESRQTSRCERDSAWRHEMRRSVVSEWVISLVHVVRYVWSLPAARRFCLCIYHILPIIS